MNKPKLRMVVIKIIDDYTVVINKGSNDGITNDQNFLVYSIDEEPLIDPITKKPLGNLEIVKGYARVKHLQENITTIESSEHTNPNRKIIKRNNPYFGIAGSTTEEIDSQTKQKPFNNVKIHDSVKII